MEYTLWFYDIDKNGEFYRAHDIFTGTRNKCYRIRKGKNFGHQYRVFRAIW